MPTPTAAHPSPRSPPPQALTALPAPDFLLALYLVPGLLHANPAIAALVELERSLQTAQFGPMWARAATPEARSVLDRVPGVDDGLRAVIASVLARTYSKLELPVARSALALATDADAAAFAAKAGWAVEQGVILLPVTADNSSKGKKDAASQPQELGLKYHELSGLITNLGRQ